MRDILLHTLLTLIVSIPGLYLHPFIYIPFVLLFFRELTQVQSKKYDNDFRRGWSEVFLVPHKLFEWLIPCTLMVIVWRLYQ